MTSSHAKAFPTGSTVHSSPVLSSDGETVFVGSHDKHLYAVASSVCNPGFEGKDCKTVDHCYQKPCQHGICVNRADGYTCSCMPGFDGNHCSKVNYCYTHNCSSHGTCRNSNSTSLDIAWPARMRGGGGGGDFARTRDHAIKPRRTGDSLPVSDLTTTTAGYTCSCNPGYFGTNCETSHCSGETCSGHGICVVGATTFTCTCGVGHFGETCSWSGLPWYGYVVAALLFGGVLFAICTALSAWQKHRGSLTYSQIQNRAQRGQEEMGVGADSIYEAVGAPPRSLGAAAATANPGSGIAPSFAVAGPLPASSVLEAAQAAAKICRVCNTPINGENFCRSCGAPTPF